MGRKLTFGQVEAILAEMQGVHPLRRAAFQSRLKQWQKMGFPEGVNVGRGVRAGYGADQLYQLVYMIELLRVGLTPDRAIEVVGTAWEALRVGILETTVCIAGGADHMHYSSIQIDSLTSLTDPAADHLHVYCRFGTDKQFGMAFFMTEDRLPEDERAGFRRFQAATLDKLARNIVFETDSLLARVWDSMRKAGVDPAILHDDTQEWRAKMAAPREAPELPLTSEPTSDEMDAAGTIYADAFALSILGYSSPEEVWAEHDPEHSDECAKGTAREEKA
jgi:hypothetical protein